jgi:nucleotide-binding universal stress UspA family protein
MKVLFATDGGLPSVAASLLLRELAARDRTSIDVITATGGLVNDPWLVHSGLEDPDSLRHADSVRDDAVAAFERYGFEAEGHVLHGDPAHEIVVASAGHDLIAMGAGTKRWVDRLFLGSVSHDVLHGSRVPVLIVRNAPFDRRVEILVAVDGSVHATSAAETFMGLADPERCRVHVVSVASIVPMFAMSGIGSGPDLVAGEIEAAEERALEIANDQARRFRDGGFDVRSSVLDGPPAICLADEAAKDAADLVVVGSRGLGPVGRIVLGSVSESVVRHARATLVWHEPAPHHRLLPSRGGGDR